VTRFRLEPARHVYRFLRKRARRLRSHIWLAWLQIRNRLVSGSVLGDAPVIVSLTSYGPRIATVAYAVESIAAGRARPRRLILWLDDAARYQTRPAALRRLEARGLEILLTTDWGPHKKYFPALPIASAASLPLVTADDDILYPRFWLSRLWAAAQRAPDIIHCYRAHVVLTDGDRIAPYAAWLRRRDTLASVANFATSGSGVYYPSAMVQALLSRGTGFTERAPRADDIWLNWVALRSGIPIRQLATMPRDFRSLPGTQLQALVQENVAGGGNDRLIASLYDSDDVETLSRALTEENRAPSGSTAAGAR
jgi:hypothetical protein